MQVWIVEGLWDYEGFNILGVFSKEESAISFMKNHAKDNPLSANVVKHPASDLDCGCHDDVAIEKFEVDVPVKGLRE